MEYAASTLLEKFDTTDLKVKIAGEVHDFEPLDYIKKNEIRKTDMFTQCGIGAAVQAMEDSGVQAHVDPTRLGVFMGSGIGGIHTFIDECHRQNGYQRPGPDFAFSSR